MIKTKLFFYLILTLLILCSVNCPPPTNTSADTKDPVDLNIENFTQDTQVWCWAACAQQIIFWKTGNYYYQCFLVGVTYGIDFCCYNPSSCLYTGQWPQIQFLLKYFGGSYSAYSLPADPVTVYKTLKQGKAILLQLQFSPYSSHCVVLKKMEWINNNPIFYLNDPMSYFTQPWTFQQLSYYWKDALVVY